MIESFYFNKVFIKPRQKLGLLSSIIGSNRQRNEKWFLCDFEGLYFSKYLTPKSIVNCLLWYKMKKKPLSFFTQWFYPKIRVLNHFYEWAHILIDWNFFMDLWQCCSVFSSQDCLLNMLNIKFLIWSTLAPGQLFSSEIIY